MVHGEVWTIKELFVYPNEYIYWTVQIVMYPFMTGLVAGAFVLSSLYHVFGRNELKNIATFSLAFSSRLLRLILSRCWTSSTRFESDVDESWHQSIATSAAHQPLAGLPSCSL